MIKYMNLIGIKLEKLVSIKLKLK